jgi:dihydroorotase
VLFDAALRARDVAPRFISHCEDERLKTSTSPEAAEDIIVARDLVIAEASGKKWHIAHVSTAGSLALIRWARSRGIDVTCEVTPHHLYFTSDLISKWGAKAAVNPPLRRATDVAALREGVREGTIDAFATDHAPHTAREKENDSPAPGFTGLEVAVGAYALALPELSLTRFVELLSTNPARILGVEGGSLRLGSPADVTVFADRPWTVDEAHLYTKGRCTPFEGKRLPRRATATIVGGRLVMRHGNVRT